MVINLYSVSSSPNTLNKVLGDSAIIENAKMYGETDYIYPVFIFKLDNPFTYNYLYSDELGRYYFIENVSSENNIYTVRCREDVLMSFKDEILELYAISESSDNPNQFMNDVNYSEDTRRTIKKYSWNNAFNSDGTFVLVAVNNG